MVQEIMVKGLFILADFDIDDPMSEYLTSRGLEYDFIPTNLEVPLVDFIQHWKGEKQNVVLIIGTNRYDTEKETLGRLYKEKSKYNDFINLTKTGFQIVFYDRREVIFWLYNPGGLKKDVVFVEWLNKLRPYALMDGKAGKFVKKKYHGFNFHEIGHRHLAINMAYPELHGLKRHNPTKDFMCLMCDKTHRDHRLLLDKAIVENGLDKGNIYRFAKKTEDTHRDLSQSFSDKVIQGTTWPDGKPPIHYYNDTNLELIVECLGHHNFDDSFLITEKTVKPISMKHPFMVLSSYNFLQNLRDLGFRTFGAYIDESYDVERDIKDRIEIITRNLQIIKGNSKKLYKETHHIREHNYRHLQYMMGTYKTKFSDNLDNFFNNKLRMK